MNRVRSGDAEIVYTVLGDGPPLVLLHPFPAHHALWLPAAQSLTSRYRIILPDLRGHGESEIGDGPATMEKHATDLSRVLDDAGVGRAIFIWSFDRRLHLVRILATLSRASRRARIVLHAPASRCRRRP